MGRKCFIVKIFAKKWCLRTDTVGRLPVVTNPRVLIVGTRHHFLGCDFSHSRTMR